MARPGRGSRRRDDELLLLLFALRRRRLARSSGRVPLWPFALAAVVLVVAALAGGAVAAGRAVQSALSDCSLAGKEAKALPITSVVYARNGYYLGAIPAPIHRQPVAYDVMSPWIRKATVAAEDRTFWTNDGLDYTSIARAALADVAAGQTVRGASTITQQLVRALAHMRPGSFERGGWQLAPFHGRRSMRHPP